MSFLYLCLHLMLGNCNISVDVSYCAVETLPEVVRRRFSSEKKSTFKAFIEEYV